MEVNLKAKAAAWWNLKAYFAAGAPLEPAVPHKGGHNDLSRWRQFGGTLDRPAPPAPTPKLLTASWNGRDLSRPVFVGIDLAAPGADRSVQIGGFPDACFSTAGNCADPHDCLMWGCARGHGTPPRDMVKHPAPAPERLNF